MSSEPRLSSSELWRKAGPRCYFFLLRKEPFDTMLLFEVLSSSAFGLKVVRTREIFVETRSMWSKSMSAGGKFVAFLFVDVLIVSALFAGGTISSIGSFFLID